MASPTTTIREQVAQSEADIQPRRLVTLSHEVLLSDEVTTVQRDSTGVDFTLNDGDHFVMVRSDEFGSVKVTLPLAEEFPGREFIIKNSDLQGFGNSISIAVSGSDTLDGRDNTAIPALNSAWSLGPNNSVQVRADSAASATEWWVV